MTTITLDGVTKEFGSERVLAPLSLAIAAGEFFTFVGGSGSGKSTILNLIAGLEEPTAGRILFNGAEVQQLPPARRDVAMVFQSYALYPHLTVFENIAFPLRLRKAPEETIRAAVGEAAARLGISAHLHKRPHALSGGQGQRTALGRALVRKPKVFLMDEPLSNLDAALRVEMRQEIKRLQAETGITTVYVTHDQEEALTLSGRIALLQNGRIEQTAPPMDLYRRPANIRVAAFVGSPAMNLFDAAPLRAAGIDTPPGDLLAGIRPHQLHAHGERREGALEAKVTLIEPAGNDIWIDCAWRGTALKARSAIEAPPPGATVWLEAARGAWHFFKKESGERV